MTELTKEKQLQELIDECVTWQGFYSDPIHDKPQRDFFEDLELVLLELRVARGALARKPFMYGIADPDGMPYFAEFCVSGNVEHIKTEIHLLNEDIPEAEPHYRLVELMARVAKENTQLPGEAF